MATIFTKIIAGEIPSYKIFENEYVYAFLDIFPQQKGHVLIVPKEEIDHFSEVPEPYYSAMMSAAKTISVAIQKATGCKRVCMTFIGYEVPHCHCHLIPTNSIDEANFSSKPQADTSELADIQQKIISFLP